VLCSEGWKPFTGWHAKVDWLWPVCCCRWKEAWGSPRLFLSRKGRYVILKIYLSFILIIVLYVEINQLMFVIRLNCFGMSVGCYSQCKMRDLPHHYSCNSHF